MAYEGEYAGYRSLARIASSAQVEAILKRITVSPGDAVPAFEALLAPVVASDWLPDLVLAIDGSYHQLPVRNGFPAAELAYVTVAAVILDIKRQRELDRHRPVNPMATRRTEEAGSIDCALPGCNVVLTDEQSPSASFRRVFYESIQDKRIFSDGETLLETYEALLSHKPTTRPQQCPIGACPGDHAYVASCGVNTCACERKNAWFSTDALRIHEGLNPNGSSGAMFAEAMQVLERIWVVNFLRWAEPDPKRLRLLRGMGIILDGPLAVFGHPAWLSQAIYNELTRINTAVREATGDDLLLIGVEKSGAFVEHFETLDTPTAQTKGKHRFRPGQVMLLTNTYIRSYIAMGEKPFGEDTYFGRKIFYKTQTGARIVATLPFVTIDGTDMSQARPDQFPRLADAMGLLDATFSARFPNAVAPIISAHAEAAIPLNLGREVLERLAKKLMAEAE